MPHANSRFSRPRATSPSASEGTLPCSAVSSAAMLLAPLVDEVADPEHDLGPLARARSRATPGRRPWRRRPRRRPLRRDAKSTHLPAARWPGRRPGPRRPDVPSTMRPPIQWPIVGSEVEAEPAGSASWVIEGSPPAEGGAAGLFPPLYSGSHERGVAGPEHGCSAVIGVGGVRIAVRPPLRPPHGACRDLGDAEPGAPAEDPLRLAAVRPDRGDVTGPTGRHDQRDGHPAACSTARTTSRTDDPVPVPRLSTVDDPPRCRWSRAATCARARSATWT